MSSSSRSDAELQRRVRQQETLASLGRRALDADELDRVMRDAVTAITETLDTDYCEVFELGSEGERLTLREGAGWPEEAVGSATVPAETGSQAGYTLHSEGPVVVEDLSAEERFDGDDLLVESGVVSGITVIVGPAADPWGVLGTHATDRREFCDADAAFVRNVANVVGSVAERAETRSRLEAVYGRVSDGFFALDEQWRFTYLNERAEELINPEGRDLVGEDVWDEFPAATERDFKPEYERAMYEQETVTFEEYYPEPLDAWFEVRAYPSESGLSVYFREITERKERERRIAAQEQRLSTLMSNVPGMVYRCRNERGWPMEFVSEGCRDLTGYDPAALERGALSFGEDVVVDADRDDLWEEIQDGLADDGQYLVTYRIETADGEIRWVRERGRRAEEPDDSGVLEGVIIDVTEEVRAERQLAEERDMFAEGPAIVFRWRNEEGWPVEYVSENVADILGYEPSALESGEVPYTDLLLDEEIDRIAAEVEAHSDGTTERFSHEPYRVRTSDGDVRWVKDTTKIVRDESGEVSHYLGYLVDITERKERERELRRYETIVETIDDGIYVKDEDGRFTMVNDAYAEMLGYDPGELVGEHASKVVDEEVVERARQEETAERDESADRPALEAEMETADGERIPAEATFATLETDDGAEQRVGVVRDVSDRKERERELRRYETIFQAVNDGLYVVDEDGRFTMVNDAYAEMLGYDPGELVGEHVSLVVDVDVRERAREEESALQEGTTETAAIEAEMKTADGERLPAEATFAMLPTGGGGQRRVGVVRDVSDRKERERELRRYERLVENLPVGVYRNTPGPDGEFVEMNEALARIFDADSREELMEVPVSDLYFDPTDRQAFSERLEREGIVRNVELLQETLDGREIWISVTGIKTEEDGEVYFDGIVQDVTDRKERERELRETERRFEAVFEDPNILVGLLEPDGTVLDINDTAMEYIDADLAAVQGEPFWETPWWGEGDDVSAEVREWTERAANGEYVEFQADLTRPDGERYTLEGYFRPVTDDDGEVVSIIVSDRDVTERREYERRLAESEQRYRTLAEHFPNGLVTLFDRDMEYTLAAGQGFDRIPVEPSDLEGETLHDVWPEETAEALEPAFEAALDGRERAVELEYEGRDWVLRGVPISDDRGEVFAGMTMALDITERKERERALEESERRYRTLAEHFPNGAVGVYDRDLRYTLAAGAKLGGALPEADRMEGERMPDLFPDHTVADLEPVFRAAVEEGETASTTTEFGGRHWRVWAAPLRDADGDIFAGLSFAQDITDQVERQRDLERYQTIVESVNDGVYVVDDEGEFQMVNNRYAEMLGYEPDELVGENASVVVDDDDELAQVDELHEASEDGQVEQPSLEGTVQTADGEALPVEATFAPLPEDEDSDWHRAGVVRDVSDRKERERALEESERRYRTLAEHFPNGAVGLFDENLEYTAVGGELVTETDVDADDRIGSSVADIYPEEIVEEIEPNFREALEGEANSFEIEFHDRYLYAHTLPVRNADDEIFAGMLVVQDVTERREYERMLEESNERLEQFAYAASHDLQEPLRMVSSYLQLIEDRYEDELDEEGKEFIDFAVDGADRMREMIDGLLQYSRVETRGDPFETVDLDEVVAEAREDLGMKIAETDAEISVEDLPQVEGDPGQLRQVFQNLLENAIEYSGEERPQVGVSAERDGDWWQISVSDDGIGIDPDEAERAFEVFQSLHDRSDYDGTGIGLALCERVIERHGGDIWVESRPGEGATFSFTLPAAEDENE